MSETLTVHLDVNAFRALAVLSRDGSPVSAAVCAALVDNVRMRARSALRAEAGRLAAEERERAHLDLR